ncbi:MAG: Nramp family divalent metal transporter [Marinicellaceae bacterium]
MMSILQNKGPGLLIAAAFIGPGTVTICSIAGAQYNFVLLWALVFSTIATIVLQEMTARLGLIAKSGLAESVRNQIKYPTLRWLTMALIMSAILVGNAAYEAGNISGGVLGVLTLYDNVYLKFAGLNINLASIAIGIIAFVLLFIGSYKLIEKTLVTLVIIMSIAFLVTAVMTQPNILAVLKGLFIPSFPEDSWLIIMALIGTTVVPYNLFLHASLVQEKWQGSQDLPKAQSDVFYSVLFGGIISMSIVIVAAAINSGEIKNAADLAIGLEPLLGAYAKYFVAIGLFAAGITSAITAPLAAAYVARGCFNWDCGLKSFKFRSVWITILVLGIVFSSTGIRPIDVIKFAQFANGLLLPLIAIFLLWVMNKPSLLGEYKNSLKQNVITSIIVLITLVLGVISIVKVFGVLK